MNPYDPAQGTAPRPWWKTTPATLGMIAAVGVFGALSFNLGVFLWLAATALVWILPPWKWGQKLIATGAAFLVLGAGAELGGQLPDTSADKPRPVAASSPPAPTSTVTTRPPAMVSVKGKTVEYAQARAKTSGYQVTVHDASDKDATPSDDWRVCFEKTTGDDSVDFGAVPGDAPCPDKDGKSIPWPTMPNAVGKTYSGATTAVAKVFDGEVDAESVYEDVNVYVVDLDDGEYDDWKVCFQAPKPTTKLKSDAEVTLWLVESGSCPTKKGTYQDPTKDPDYTPPPAPTKPKPKPQPTETRWNGQCEIVSNAGNCYDAGQFCRNADVGRSTHAGNGRIIYCRDQGDYNRWGY